MRTWRASRSRLEYTATVPMPSSRHVRITRTAISPRFAMRTFWSTLAFPPLRRAFTIARAVWCLPCGAASGRSTGSTRSTPPTPTSVTGPATGPPTGSSRWPTTRPPAGAASTAAGSRRRGRTCWPRCSCGPAAAADDVHLCAGAVALAGGRRLPGGRRGRAGAQVAQRPAGRRAPSWPASWPRRSSPGAPWRPSSSASGSTWPGPGPPEAGGTCLDDLGGTAQPVDRQVLLDRLLGALDARCALLDEAAGRRALADEVRRRCATLGQRGPGRSWPARS